MEATIKEYDFKEHYPDCTVSINNVIKEMSEVTSKEVYHELVVPKCDVVKSKQCIQ